MKRLLAIALLIAVSVFIFACSKDTATDGKSVKKVTEIKVGLYLPPFDDYFGDFYELAEKGIKDIQKEYPGVKFEKTKVSNVVYEAVYSEELAKKSDILVFMSFPLNQAYSELTLEYPDKYFIGIESYIDGNSYDEPLNGSGNFAREEQAGYLAGVIAATLTTDSGFPGMNKDKKLGFIGAVRSTFLNRNLGGFQQAVWTIDPDIAIKDVWGEDNNPNMFNNPQWAYKEAKKMYGEGTDIIFTVGGKTAEGVYKAAQETGKYVIGTDGYKGYLAPGHVLAGVNRRVDQMIYLELKNIIEQQRQKEQGIIKEIKFHSGAHFYGIPEGIIEINDLIGMEEEKSWLKEGKINQEEFDKIKELKGNIPEELIQEIASVKDNILNGGLQVRENTGPLLEFDKVEGEVEPGENPLIE